MIITVLWEDQRGVPAKGFGPHELLVACVAEKLGLDRSAVKHQVNSVPKKGNGNVVVELRKNLTKLRKLGQVVVVLDHDRLAELLRRKTGGALPACMSGQSERLRQIAPGDYEVKFLIQNVETLTEAAVKALRREALKGKPTPDERDRLLGEAARPRHVEVRRRITSDVPSFARLVNKVAAHFPPPRRLIASVEWE